MPKYDWKLEGKVGVLTYWVSERYIGQNGKIFKNIGNCLSMTENERQWCRYLGMWLIENQSTKMGRKRAIFKIIRNLPNMIDN